MTRKLTLNRYFIGDRELCVVDRGETRTLSLLSLSTTHNEDVSFTYDTYCNVQ